MKKPIGRVLRLLIDEVPVQGGEVKLDAARSHHLVTVLRADEGQEVLVLDGRGGTAKAILREAGRHCRLDCRAPARHPDPTLLLQAWMPLIRTERLDVALEKLTELGVSRVCLYSSAHSGNLRRPADMARLRRICEAALEQSGNPWLPQVDAPVQLESLLAGRHEPLVLASPGASPLTQLPVQTGALALVAGPEGGFSPEELELLQARAVAKVGLGPHILRAETAMILLAGVLQSLSVGH